MDDFLNKQSNRNRRAAPIDGVTGRPQQARFNQGGNMAPQSGGPDSHSPHPGGSLNGFKRPEGFHATQQQQIRPTPVIRRPEPIIVERNTAGKRSRLVFWRKENGLDGNGRRKRRITRKQKIIRGVIIATVITAMLTGFLFAKGFINLRKVLQGGGGAAALQQNVDPSKLNGEGDGRVNILLLGRGGEGHEGADLTDTIILASIDPIAKEAALVSVPRDLYVKVAESGSMKVNSVFALGKSGANIKDKKKAEDAGFELLEHTLEDSLGVPIHYRSMVDFAGFEQAIDTVGGITVNAPTAVVENMRIQGKSYKLDVKPGVQDMGGFEALAYSRSRYTSARGDFDRAERQRLIITALKEKVLTIGTFGNPQKISELLGNFGSHVQTNFSPQDLQRLYDLTKDINSSKINSVGFADPPNNFVTTDSIGGTSVVVPRAGLGNFKEIQNFLRNTLKDSYLKNENASVMILNGTTKAGLATEKADELRSFGYNVTEVGNAPTKNYAKSVVIDLRNGSKKYTRNYLEKRFKVPAVNSVPDPTIVPGAADFVIIIGNDFTNN